MPSTSTLPLAHVLHFLSTHPNELTSRAQQDDFLTRLTRKHKYPYFSATYGHTIHDARSLRAVLAAAVRHHPNEDLDTDEVDDKASGTDLLFKYGKDVLDDEYIKDIMKGVEVKEEDLNFGIDDEDGSEDADGEEESDDEGVFDDMEEQIESDSDDEDYAPGNGRRKGRGGRSKWAQALGGKEEKSRKRRVVEEAEESDDDDSEEEVESSDEEVRKRPRAKKRKVEPSRSNTVGGTTPAELTRKMSTTGLYPRSLQQQSPAISSNFDSQPGARHGYGDPPHQALQQHPPFVPIDHHHQQRMQYTSAPVPATCAFESAGCPPQNIPAQTCNASAFDQLIPVAEVCKRDEVILRASAKLLEDVNSAIDKFIGCFGGAPSDGPPC